GLQDQIMDLGPELADLSLTASVLRELDLLITPDTSVPHLAGTLGRPTWLMLHHPADWRWGQSGESSPWYPEVRLFRQKRFSDWSGVVEEVNQALCEAK
ncbi:MAG: hypothetical protein AAF236_02350, partial [Verrucomicrobiota bacterium]